MTDNFFDSLNVTKMFQGKKKNKDFLQPYERVDECRLGVSCCVNKVQDLIYYGVNFLRIAEVHLTQILSNLAENLSIFAQFMILGA